MEPHIINFPEHFDPTGILYVADAPDLPFIPRRAFWITDLNYSRGSHVLKTCEQILIAVSGEFNVDVFYKNKNRVSWRLSNPSQGLYMPPMTWRVLYQFLPGSVALMLASEPYNPDDYFQYFSDYLEFIHKEGLKFSDEIP